MSRSKRIQAAKGGEKEIGWTNKGKASRRKWATPKKKNIDNQWPHSETDMGWWREEGKRPRKRLKETSTVISLSQKQKE